jgi:thioredoxin-dependent peroxiredoxin
MTLEIGFKAPAFSMAVTGGKTLTLDALAGQNIVLYFYPKDDTPGCTTEACAFRDGLPDFKAVNAVIIGVSRDSIEKHEAFAKKYDLPFLLAADPGAVSEAYGVWTEKKNYGKTYMGIERTTFLIDKTGTIQKIWRKVKVDGHAEKVLAELRAL